MAKLEKDEKEHHQEEEEEDSHLQSGKGVQSGKVTVLQRSEGVRLPPGLEDEEVADHRSRWQWLTDIQWSIDAKVNHH